MRIIPGKKKDSFLLFHNGYKYARDYDSDYIYRCSKRKTYVCSARVKFVIDVFSTDDMKSVTDDHFEIIGSHEDMPDHTISEWLDMIDTMKERCRTSHDQLIDIFNDVCREESAKNRPPIVIPKTLLELSQSLNATSVIKVYLVAGRSSVLIFTSDKLLTGFAKSNELFTDGTFSYHAGAIILTENQDTGTYVTIFNWLTSNVEVLKEKEISWLFFSFCADEGMNYSRLDKGLPTKKHTPQYLIDRCNYIRKTQDDLDHG
ncbi:hypothetical protein KQX54_012691 [Cotesia glomerata]|uniref:FLYWCH-type domain-containing protein n=1 Tax=Cotesia glomerata TaxID=32391 RepID=A0AAV7IAA1_COTGL|nr:hypothetical protein KQX54_012691 [Cotesia glomerata]